MALVKRVPKGPVLGIAPFNFPLNLVAHKVAPALAVGAPILVKPAPATPLSALVLGELHRRDRRCRAGMWSVLPVPNDRMPELVPTLGCRSSRSPGRRRSATRSARPCPHKHVVLELGGNAAAVVLGDFGADAGPRVGGSADRDVRQLPGRAVVHLGAAGARRPPDLRRRRRPGGRRGRAAGHRRPVDDPPPTSARSSTRTPPCGSSSWIDEAVAAGAKLLTGGVRDGAARQPGGARRRARTTPRSWCEEVFGPVLVLAPVDGVDGAIAAVNDSRFGLQTGVFTKDTADGLPAASPSCRSAA